MSWRLRQTGSHVLIKKFPLRPQSFGQIREFNRLAMFFNILSQILAERPRWRRTPTTSLTPVMATDGSRVDGPSSDHDASVSGELLGEGARVDVKAEDSRDLSGEYRGRVIRVLEGTVSISGIYSLGFKSTCSAPNLEIPVGNGFTPRIL